MMNVNEKNWEGNSLDIPIQACCPWLCLQCLTVNMSIL